MSIKMLLSTGYIITLLLGSFCPMQMAAAISMPQDSMQHEEMNMTPMTPPMTPVALMSVAPVIGHNAHATMPVLPSGNCTTGHCFMVHHADQQLVFVSTFTVQVATSAALPSLQFTTLTFLDSFPAPPDTGSLHLAQTISTIVLRV